MFSLICVWINGWVNNREAGDLRRRRGHYDVIVMYTLWSLCNWRDYFLIHIMYYGYMHPANTHKKHELLAVFPGMGISIIKLRRSWDHCLIFITRLVYWKLDIFIYIGMKPNFHDSLGAVSFDSKLSWCVAVASDGRQSVAIRLLVLQLVLKH